MSKRVLISTQVFPPMVGGSAVILYELLKHLPQDEMVAVHGINDPPNLSGASLDIERHAALVLGSYRWSLRCNRRWPELYVPLIRHRLLQLAKKHSVQRIYAHFPSAPFVVAAWQTAEKLDLPLTVYFDILWEESYAGAAALAVKYEKRILERADKRFAITEFAADYLTKKHGVKVDFLPHTIDLSYAADGFQTIPQGAPPTIHFCGGIYPKMNQDAVIRLADAAERANCRPSLDLCTPSLPDELQRRGMSMRYLSREELRLAQRQSTILYLPMAFASDHPTMIRYNFPTKAMEYLCSGRPILVHAPAECYLTSLAKKEGFAMVVDRPDTNSLAAAIDQLSTNEHLQREFVANAFRFAKSRDSRIWSNVLSKALCNGE